MVLIAAPAHWHPFPTINIIGLRIIIVEIASAGKILLIIGILRFQSLSQLLF